MSARKVAHIEGTITFDDGATAAFLIGADESSRWGNTTEVLGDAVDVCDAIVTAVSEEGLFA